MKIRLQSIDGKLADPIFNATKMEAAIRCAKEEGINLLIFPINSLRGESLGDLAENNSYVRQYQTAKEFLKDIIQKHQTYNFKIWFDNFGSYPDFMGKRFIVNNYSQEESLERLSNIEEVLKADSLKSEFIHITCFGRGTESVCQRIYSNVKIIAYQGKIIASNLETDDNIVDADLNFEKELRYPYLTEISNGEKMFENILRLQGIGLYNKMESMNRWKICLGVSGGLDSTVSLLACVEIFNRYHIPLKNIIGVTMPGLGTTERTHQNALNLMTKLGITIEEIDLRPLLKTHLKNISQPEGKFDVTFEQTQSRERTQVLLDIANRENAIMIGTGCMSEFALGWMTYGGDHLCMYAINIGLPKTVVKFYAQWFIDTYSSSNKKTKQELATIIKDILNGPVSPELLPIDEKGEQHEKTESLIGDYAVQDFFIYHMTVDNYSIIELFNEACEAFPEYSHENILKWLEIFTLRYFTRAYKKNCYGDGIQLFEYSVSPWHFHIPSDIDNNIWEEEIRELKFKYLEQKGE